MLGGLLGNLLVPRLAEDAGLPAGLTAGAAAMLLVAVASLGLTVRHVAEPARSVHPAASG